MTADAAILKAQEALGTEREEDYQIWPTQHAKELEARAPALAQILRSSKVQATADAFERDDQQAVAAQRTFTRTFIRANWMTWLTGACAALILATAALQQIIPGEAEKFVFLALGLASLVLGIVAAMDLTRIKDEQLLEAWMSRRAEAETHRLAYFEEVMKAPGAEAPAAVPLRLLKLEYFRRFQLDVQRLYYGKRSEDHKQDAQRSLAKSRWAVAGATALTGLAAVLAWGNTEAAALAAVGGILTGLSAFHTIREAVYQYRRNAERYERTARALNGEARRLDEVRKAVFEEGEIQLLAYVADVHEYLSVEHREWREDQQDRLLGVAEVVKLLQEHKEAAKPAGGTR